MGYFEKNRLDPDNFTEMSLGHKIATGALLLAAGVGLAKYRNSNLEAKEAAKPPIESIQNEVKVAALAKIEPVAPQKNTEPDVVEKVAVVETPKVIAEPKPAVQQPVVAVEQKPEQKEEALPYATDEELMAGVNDILKDVDYKEGIHRNLVSGTVIIELKNGGKLAAVVVGPNMALVPTAVANMIPDIKVIRGGAPFQAKKSRWEVGESLEVKKNVLGDLALISFNEDLFPQETGLNFEPNEVKLGKRTPIIICANPTGMEARSRVGALTGEQIDTNHFEVKIAPDKGLLGGLVTGVSGDILGIIETVTADKVILRTIDEYESFEDLKQFNK